MFLRGSPGGLSPIIHGVRQLNSTHHVDFPPPPPYVPHFLLLLPGVTQQTHESQALSQALLWGESKLRQEVFRV